MTKEINAIEWRLIDSWDRYMQSYRLHMEFSGYEQYKDDMNTALANYHRELKKYLNTK